MSTWSPSRGLQQAEMLVQALEIEAVAAGAKITPVFRHRMVEQIAKLVDNATPDAPVNQLLNGQLRESKQILETAPVVAREAIAAGAVGVEAVSVPEATPAPKRRGRPPGPKKR